MQHRTRTYHRLSVALTLAVLFSLLWTISGRGRESDPTLSSPPAVWLHLRSGTIDPITAYPQGDLAPAFTSSQPGLFLVQFPGPIQDAWLAQLVTSGLEIVTYIPDYTYLVWGSGETVEAQQQTLPIRWAGAYKPDFAVHPELSNLNNTLENIAVTVQLFTHPSSDASLRQIQAVATGIVRDVYAIPPYRNITVLVPQGYVPELASLQGVINVEPALMMQLHDEVQGMILAGQLTSEGSLNGPGYLDWLVNAVGFPQSAGAYPIVDITDDGFDNGTTTPLHPDFYKLGDINQSSRVMYTVNWTSDVTANNTGGHGSLNASIVGGYNATDSSAYEDINGYQYGLGINPFGRIAASKVFANAGGWDAPSYDEIVGQSYNNGARIINNSWGESLGNGEYTVHDQAYDYLVRDADTNATGNQEISIIFSAGNAGPQATTIGSPANAKNVISVGASENLRPTWMDGCLVGGGGADNIDDIINFSSRGPTADGRIKPELVAPGTHIQGTASQATGYLGNTVCDKYHPLEQTLYAASSGTSHAAPALASAASLLHWFTQSHYTITNPSPAMVKAYLVNSTVYMDGIGTSDTLPSPNQGFGRLDISVAFRDLPRLLVDQSIVMRSTGQVYSQVVRLPDTNEPLRVTLAWTDAPGATIGDAYVNNLDLEVEIDGDVYRGNVFSGSLSVPGGIADQRNNVESIILPPDTGNIATIRVVATNIAGDGLPGNADFTDQDFALVCSNCDQPPFALQVSPYSGNVCVAGSTSYTVSTSQVLASHATIELSTQQLPTQVQSTFSANPIGVGAYSTLTLNTTSSAIPGSYTFKVSGKDLEHGGIITQEAELVINTVPPIGVSALTPINNSVDISLMPTFTWEADPLAGSYLLELALDGTFSEPVMQINTPLTSASATNSLDYATEYFWRVTPVNGCGTGSPTSTQRFVTRFAPRYICSAPGLSIPDNNTKGITHTMKLPAYGDILDMQVQISITHEFAGDLIVTLTHLDSDLTTILLDRPGYPVSTAGCAGQNVNITLDDRATLNAEDACQNYIAPAYAPEQHYAPATPLSIHNNGAVGGSWALNVADVSVIDHGILDGWCLIPTIRNQNTGVVLYLPFIFKASNF